jgi:hypothetical protein
MLIMPKVWACEAPAPQHSKERGKATKNVFKSWQGETSVGKSVTVSVLYDYMRLTCPLEDEYRKVF